MRGPKVRRRGNEVCIQFDAESVWILRRGNEVWLKFALETEAKEFAYDLQYVLDRHHERRDHRAQEWQSNHKKAWNQRR